MITAICVLAAVVLGAAVLWCIAVVLDHETDGPWLEPKQPSKSKRIEHLSFAARHYRDQMAGLADEFVDLHGVEPGTCDADDLMSHIYDGWDYDEVMARIESRNRREEVA